MAATLDLPGDVGSAAARSLASAPGTQHREAAAGTTVRQRADGIA
jgi:hypothetical protein